jgi:predicted anti-sigma-YlaC factor YlaD
MALPELLLPPGTPAFQADGHVVELVPQHADVSMRTGQARKRRVYTTTPRLVSVALELSQAMFTAFDAWFEGPLQAGALPFTAQVANLGAGLLYWQATFEGPYTATPNDAATCWTVTAQLRLVGDGQVAAPAATSLAADTYVALAGSATLVISQTLAADTVVALLAAGGALAADTVVRLLAFHGYLLREDGTPYQREDGTFIERE